MKDRPVLRRSVIFSKQLEHPLSVLALAPLGIDLDLAEAGDCKVGGHNRRGVFGQFHSHSLRAGFDSTHDSGRQGAGNGALAARGTDNGRPA